MDEKRWVDKVSGKCGGRACIAGTRMPVWLVWQLYIAGGKSPREVRALYPHLSMLQIHKALDYAAAHQEEIGSDIADNDADGEE